MVATTLPPRKSGLSPRDIENAAINKPLKAGSKAGSDNTKKENDSETVDLDEDLRPLEEAVRSDSYAEAPDKKKLTELQEQALLAQGNSERKASFNIDEKAFLVIQHEKSLPGSMYAGRKATIDEIIAEGLKKKVLTCNAKNEKQHYNS